jgi:lysyl endopeptidase
MRLLPPTVIRRHLAGLLLAGLFAMPAGATEFRPELKMLADVPRHTLPAAAVEKRLAATPRKEQPYDFAVAVPVQLTAADGLWNTLDAQTLGWRLRLHSAGAQSLSLHFSRFELPPGARLWIYGPDGVLVHGPYTAADSSAAGLWTPVVPGDELAVELRVPTAQAGQMRLEIAHAYHGYRDFKDANVQAKAGACNVDIACSEAAAWLDEVRSVARIQISDGVRSVLCSGQLVNNARQDLTPYFMTANHCGIDDAGKASSVVVYFNYQRSQCGGAANGDLSQTMSGSTLVAGHQDSDFTLIRLGAEPPSSYAVYYAGWNVRGEGSGCGASMHHPSGHEKAISLYDKPVAMARITLCMSTPPPGQTCPAEDRRDVDTWRVTWTRGTTESGSSGAGLWNQQHELIGVLSGGSASCEQRDNPDFYGRLDVAWNGDGTSTGQLKAHLDPDNLGLTRLPGRDPQREPLPIGSITSTDCGTVRHPSGRRFLGLFSIPLLGLLLIGGMARMATSATPPAPRRRPRSSSRAIAAASDGRAGTPRRE